MDKTLLFIVGHLPFLKRKAESTAKKTKTWKHERTG